MVDEKVFGKITAKKKDLFVPESLEGNSIGGSMEDIFAGKIDLDPRTGKGAEEFKRTWDKQTLATNLGQVSGSIIPMFLSGGIGFVSKLTKTGSKIVTLPITARTILGTPVKEALPVAREITVLGKTIVTKTYKNPEIIKSVKKNGKEIVKGMESKKGDYSLGSAKPEKVLDRVEFNPQGRGYEVLTGGKKQTKFNKDVLHELVSRGKLDEKELEFVELVEKGVKLSNKAPSKIYSGFGAKPIGSINEGIQTTKLFDSLKVLQSKKNWTVLQKKIGQIGGSLSQNPQLKNKYQKSSIHDVDIDVSSEKIAKRGAELVESFMKPLSTKEKQFVLSDRGTKVMVKDKNGSDEFIEFLSPKDALKGNEEAISSGLRFGEKYKSDSLIHKLTSRPIKEKETGIVLRDIKDQTLAKASSVLSVQGKSTEKFKTAPGQIVPKWEAEQNRLIDAGILNVNSPALRGKDTVDLYNIFKSQAEKFIDIGQTTRGKKLDIIAEKIKSKNPLLDFSENRKGDIEIINFPSTSSLLSKSITSNSDILTPGIVPGVKVNLNTDDILTTKKKPKPSKSTSKPKERKEKSYSVGIKLTSKSASRPATRSVTS